MSALTTFDSTKQGLFDLLRSIKEGHVQLPDFQRGWIWDDEHIRGLLASISLSYPIGAVMLLQTGNADVRFKPRLVEGVTLTPPPAPDQLILDGQQRLTSLYQALFSGQAVATRDARGAPIRRWYYLDINKALDPTADRDDAIVGVPEDRKTRTFRGLVDLDYSTPELEQASGMFPLPLVFDIAGLTTWMMAYLQDDHGRRTQWNNLVQEVIQRFQQYQVPVILLSKDTPKEAVCQVFEKVNTGGVSLTVFELLTATYAADNFDLRADWAIREKHLKRLKVLGHLESTDFLQAVTLLATLARQRQALANGAEPGNAPGISCKRKEVLKLALEDYRAWADGATEGFEKAARLLQAQRIFAARDVPYRTQLTPLAAILAILGSRADSDGVRQMLAQWYWCGVFGELYGGAIETRFAKDLPEVLHWIDGGPVPDTIRDANFAPARLHSLRTRNSAAYKGLYTLVLRQGGLDFRTGEAIDLQMYFDDSIDIHHVFPQSWCKTKGIELDRCDSVVNKTPLSARTNRTIGGSAPSAYLPRIQNSAGIGEGRMDEILRSHLIDPVALRADDFGIFFQERERALLSRIEQAMGKAIARDAVLPELPTPEEYEEDDQVA